MGGNHIAFVTKKGRVFASGYNQNKECGLPGPDVLLQPELIKEEKIGEVVSVVCALQCTLFLNKKGEVWGCGASAGSSVSVRALQHRLYCFQPVSFFFSSVLKKRLAEFGCERAWMCNLRFGDTMVAVITLGDIGVSVCIDLVSVAKTLVVTTVFSYSATSDIFCQTLPLSRNYHHRLTTIG